MARRAAKARTNGELGLSLAELMVATALAGLASTFVFWISGRTSLAYRTQARVAELQQTLRSAGDLVARDLREAGFMVSSYRTALTGTTDILPFNISNNVGTEGDDMFSITYADPDFMCRVSTTGPAFPSAETELDSLGGFQVGDVVLAVRIANPKLGEGCILKITALAPAGPHFRAQHNPGAEGQPWNQPGNSQCDNLNGIWNDGYTVFTKFASKAFRIRPDDQRGVLEVSTSGGFVVGDWQELALGIVDMQVAIRVYQAGDVVDQDADGDAERDWYSSDNMPTILGTAGVEMIQAKVSLVARTTAQVNGVLIPKTPDLTVVGNEANNDLGDHAGTVLPVSSLASRYYGDHIYRWTTVLVDARNMGVGL